MTTNLKDWDTLWNLDDTCIEYKIHIGKDVYTGENDIEMDSFRITRPVFSSSSLIGNCSCSTLECCIRQGNNVIPRGAWVKGFMRLVNGNEETSWATLGEFKIHSRHQYPDGWVKFICRDRMQMANQTYFQGAVENDSWPKSMKEVLNDTSLRIGVKLDPRSVIMEGPSWRVTPPVGLSIRKVWAYIAAAHGGNFVITPQNTLLLVHPIINYHDAREVSLSEGGFEALGPPVTVDQLTYKVNSEYQVSSGSPGVNNVTVDCPYANIVTVDYAKSLLSGVLYHPIRVSNLRVDPRLDPYNTFSCDGLLTTWSEWTMTCGAVTTYEAVSEAPSEPESEYGFEDTPTNQLRQYTDDTAGQLRAYADETSQSAVDGQTQESIFNKLTNNGKAQGIYLENGQLYINASYLNTGTLKAILVKLLGKFEVYEGETLGGYLGYMKGNTGTQETNGIGVSNVASDCYVVATDAGVAMRAGSKYFHLVDSLGGTFVGPLRVRGDLTVWGDLEVQGTIRAKKFEQIV